MHSCLASVAGSLLNPHLPFWGQTSLVNLDVCVDATSSLDLPYQQGSSSGKWGSGLLKGPWKGCLIEQVSKANLYTMQSSLMVYNAVGWWKELPSSLQQVEE